MNLLSTFFGGYVGQFPMDIMSWSNSDRYVPRNVPMLVKFCFVCSLICGVHVDVFCVYFVQFPMNLLGAFFGGCVG